MKIITFITMFMAVISVNAQNIKESFGFLEGTWKVENKETYEEWSWISESQLKGTGYKIIDGEREISEYLEISENDNSITYTATVPNQNNGQGVDFKLNRPTADEYSFENLNHDFPKKIIYKKLNDEEVFVRVLGEGDKGFSFKMLKQKPKTIPIWFVDNLKANIGKWQTDNGSYKSEAEPYDAYGMEWTWGIGQTSMTGKLYGIQDGKVIGDFWKFRQYWDNVKGEAAIQQFGYSGVIGLGTVKPTENDKMESIQTFSLPDGRNWIERHLSKLDDNELTTTSYEKNEEGNWKKKRSYTWKKEGK